MSLYFIEFKDDVYVLKRGLLLFLLYFCAVGLASAVGVVSVNEGIVWVDGKNVQRQAMQQVVIKMTGSKESLSNSGVLKALKDASDYILSYEYFIENNQQKYKAVFDTAKIEALIRQEELPLWGAQRPEAIVWLAYANSADDIQLITDSDLSGIGELIQQHSQARGVQMLFPLMDLDDSLAISKTDVWARFLPVLRKASERYSSEYMITARLITTSNLRAQQETQRGKNTFRHVIETHKLSGVRGFDRDALTLDVALQNEEIQYQQKSESDSNTGFNTIDIPDNADLALEWYIESKNEQNLQNMWTGREFGNNANMLLQQLIDTYTEKLGEKYAIATGDMPSVRPIITVSNVQSLKDIVALTRYLETLTVVDSTRLVQMQGNLATFEISLLGAMSDLYISLDLGTRLTAIEDTQQTESTVTGGQPLHFFWQG